MVTYVSVNGFVEYVKFADHINPRGPPVYFYFDAKRLDGTSYCPDCVEAEPTVRAYLREVKKELIFVYVECSARDFPKNPHSAFRMDIDSKRLRVGITIPPVLLPTLLKWGGGRLEGTELNDTNNLRRFFEE